MTDAAPSPDADLDADAHLIEHRLSSSRVYDGSFLKVDRDAVRFADGVESSREYILHPGAVMIVPIADDGRLVVERQYRYPLRQVLLEFPAGKIEPGEPTRDCAIRELAEETGYRAREWACAGRLHNAPAYSDEFIEIWFARGLTLGERQLDIGESLDVLLLEPEDLLARVASGELTDAKSMVGLLWLQNWRAGRWVLEWQRV